MRSGGACCTNWALLLRRSALPTVRRWTSMPKRKDYEDIDADVQPALTEAASEPAKSRISSDGKQRVPRNFQLLSRTKLRKIRVPPPRLLAEWLQETEGGYIVPIAHRQDRNKVRIPDLLSMQNVLLERLKNDHSAESMYRDSVSTLERLGYTVDDLREWVRILKSYPHHTSAYLQSEAESPLFLLLVILRYNNLSKSDVRALLVHTWYLLLGYSKKETASIISEDCEDLLYAEEWCLHPWTLSSAPTTRFREIEQNAFMILISRFLNQARRTLPQAIPSITYLFGCYLWFTKGTLVPHLDGSANSVDSKVQRQLSKLYNQVIKILSLPSKVAPARNMKFGWEGQKFLLEQAGRYVPPLLLDQDAYRSIIRALSASKKSATEQDFVRNMVASWPPWRDTQHAVDVGRPIEDDLSRPVQASRHMVEAGYHLDFLDWEMQIIGGRDVDGSPTIATRHISTRRAHKMYGKERMWVARVKATRNVREAWMAFMEFNKQKVAVTVAFYHAVFEKLVFERLRHIRPQRSEALPGEGKEVMQYAFHNFNADELARAEPMEEYLLYNHMIESGIVPSGRFLDFMVRNAPSVATGIRYLQDSNLNRHALGVMLDCTLCEEKEIHVLDMIPASNLDAFIRLLCRFAYGHSSTEIDHLPSKRHGKPVRPNLSGVKRQQTPLHYAVCLVRLYKPLFRPAWYSLFRGLAAPHAVIAASFVGHPMDDVLSWHVLKQLRAEFHSCKLEFELTAFHHICVCFEKAMLSSWRPEGGYFSSASDILPSFSGDWIHEDLEAIKKEWRNMAESTPMPFATPRLLHSFHHAVIHSYIRVLGFARDWLEMVRVLRWMIDHRKELDEEVEEWGNGRRMRKRVLIAMRAFVERAKKKETEPEGQQDRDAGEPEPHQNVPTQILHNAETGHENDSVEHNLHRDLPTQILNSDAQTGHENDSAEHEPQNFESQDLLYVAEERLRLLLNQEGLEEWGGWPHDNEIRDYDQKDNRLRYDAE